MMKAREPSQSTGDLILFGAYQARRRLVRGGKKQVRRNARGSLALERISCEEEKKLARKFCVSRNFLSSIKLE